MTDELLHCGLTVYHTGILCTNDIEQPARIRDLHMAYETRGAYVLTHPNELLRIGHAMGKEGYSRRHRGVTILSPLCPETPQYP